MTFEKWIKDTQYGLNISPERKAEYEEVWNAALNSNGIPKLRNLLSPVMNYFAIMGNPEIDEDDQRFFLGNELSNIQKHLKEIEEILDQPTENILLNKSDQKFLLGLIVRWAKHVPSKEHAWDPMFWGTLSREDDIKVHVRLCEILGLPRNID